MSQTTEDAGAAEGDVAEETDGYAEQAHGRSLLSQL
jgi:hypothetical protein